jgi:hypothetical protein
MTTEERFEKIEHITAGMAEQARSDREENRQLWRETQRQIDELGGRVARITIDIDRLILESAARDKASRERDQALDTRLDKLVSAIGEFIAAQPKSPPQ